MNHTRHGAADSPALYKEAGWWHFSPVRFTLSSFLLCAVLCASCASRQKDPEQERRQANSRAVESRRMRALDYGDVTSQRGAEMLVVDPDKSFNLKSMSGGTSKTFRTGSANVKDFNYVDNVSTRSYTNTRGFWGSRQSAFSEQRFATRGARTTGDYEIPNATKKAGTKTATTKEAREANLAMAVRTLPDGSRQYLGKEKKKMETPVDPKEAANWRGASAMVTTGGDMGAGKAGRRYITPVEQYGHMKEISVEELRELLNKNK